MADNDKIEKVIIETENKVLDRILFIYFFFCNCLWTATAGDIVSVKI